MAQQLTPDLPTAPRPAKRLGTWTMTREALTIGFDVGEGFFGRARGTDFARFRCGGRRFVVLSHPDYIDHVLHAARLRYVKSNEYEPIRAAAGINLLTDEGDSWATHRSVLNPMFARRHLNDLVDLIIEPIAAVTEELWTRGDRVTFDMHQTMVQVTLRVVANALFSQDFGPLVRSMNDLTTKGMRKAEKLERLGLLGLLPRPVYDALMATMIANVRLPPPLRDLQEIVRTLDSAVNAIIDERRHNPTDGHDLLNVLFEADGGTWPRTRVRDEAFVFMLAGHESTADAISWF